MSLKPLFYGPFVIVLSQFANGQTPSIDAIVNPVTYIAGPSAPGGVVSIFGTNLAATTAAPPAPLPSTLAGVTVRIGDRPAALEYISPRQINAIIPWDAEAGAAAVTVTLNGNASAARNLTIAAAAPVLLSAVRSATRASGPYSRGEYLTLFAGGLGAVKNAPPAGGYTATGKLAETNAPVTVTIGGVATPAAFAGLAPPDLLGAAISGLYQIDVQVPAAAPIAANVPVAVTIGGVQSNALNVAILAADASRTLYAWTQYGPSGAIARVITSQAECPLLALDGAAMPMQMRAKAAAPWYPVTSCELAIPAATQSAMLDQTPLPLPKPDLTRIAVIGDTGCRLDATRLQACNDPVEWPAAQVAASVAASKPDLIVQLGDVHYREVICPPSNASCAGSPWGYNWATWNVDVLAPLSPMFPAAPIVMIRGNHEMCDRAGEGWFRFLDPRSMPESCQKFTDPYTVPAGPTTIFVIDSSEATDTTAAPALVANFRPYFDQLAKAVTPNTWVAMHHPIWGFDATGTRNLSLQTASQNKLPEGVQMLLAGHIHVFETLTFSPARPPQMIAGIGGDVLQAYAANVNGFNGQTIGGAGVVESYLYKDFGFTTMDWDGNAWNAIVRDPAGNAMMNCSVGGAAIKCKQP